MSCEMLRDHQGAAEAAANQNDRIVIAEYSTRL
jgi:hypothetical protein